MLAAYYSKGCQSEELFRRFKIAEDASFIEKLNRYNVIKIDMNSEYQNARVKENMIERLEEKIKRELATAFPAVRVEREDSLGETILNVYGATGETFIFLLDEYDVLVREQVRVFGNPRCRERDHADP